MPANTARARPRGGSETRPAGGHVADGHPWRRPAGDALLQRLGETVPRRLAALDAALARRVGG